MSRRLTICAALAVALCPAMLLADIGEDIEKLGTSSEIERAKVLDELTEKGLEAFDDLIEGLENENSVIRTDCAGLLGALNDTRAIDPLLKHLVPPAEGVENAEGEDSSSVRVACIGALVRLAAKERGPEIGGRFLTRMTAEGLENHEKYALASALAELSHAPAEDAMNGLLTPQGDPALGSCAVRFFGSLGSAGHEKLLAFLDNKNTVGEGDAATERWAFSTKWNPVKTSAVIILAAARHPRGIQLIIEEVSQRGRMENVVQDRIADVASGYGAEMVQPLIEVLKDKDKRGQTQIQEKVLAVLGRLGWIGLEALIQLGDEGIAIVNAAEAEGKTEPNPYYLVVTKGIALFRETDEGRDALLRAYKGRPKSGDDEIRDQLFEELVQSASPQARDAILDGLQSDQPETLKKCIGAWIRSQGSRDLAPLESLTDHGHAEVREELAKELSGSGVVASKTRGLLLKLSKDANATVRELVWSGLAKSDDSSLIEEFERGMKDEARNVQAAAAKEFPALLTKIKVNDDEQKAGRVKAISMVKTALEARGGAALGVLDAARQYYNQLFKDAPEGGSECILLLGGFFGHEEADLRIAAAKLAVQTTIWRIDWTEDLLSSFLVEEDSAAAAEQMSSIDRLIGTGKLKNSGDDAYEASREQQKELVNRVVTWLGKDKPGEGSTKMSATSASMLLGKIATKLNFFTDTNRAVKKVINDTLVKEGLVDEDKTAIAFGIQALYQMKSKGNTPLVIKALEKFPNHEDIKNKGTNYLTQLATSKDLPRIESLTMLNNQEKQRIRTQITNREKR